MEVVVIFPEVTSGNLLLGGGDRHTERGVLIVDVIAVRGLVVVGEDGLGSEVEIVGRILRRSEVEQLKAGYII